MNVSNVKNYKVGEFAKLLNISIKTLQRWDNDGLLKARRTPTNRRYYTYDQYLSYFNMNAINCSENVDIVIHAKIHDASQIDYIQKQCLIENIEVDSIMVGDEQIC